MQQSNIEIKNIKESKSNSRTITNESLSDLMASIEAIGVLQPVIVSKSSNNGSYDLIAGHRRLRASKLLKLDTIPAVVMDVKEDDAQAICVAENMIRENLSPIEEAEAIETLLKKGFTPERAADQLGKTVQFILRRKQLINLSRTWIKRLKDSNHSINKYWGSGHLEIISRYDHVKQELLAKDFVVDWSYRNIGTSENFKEYLEKEEFKLSGAPWKLEDEVLVPQAGSCLNCNKRSGCEPILFHDDDNEKCLKKNERCLDEQCWDTKTKAFVRQKIKELKKEHDNLIYVSAGYPPLEDKYESESVDDSHVKRVKKTDKNAIPAIYISKEKAGKVIWISKLKSKSANEGSHSQEKKPKSIQEKVDGLKKRRRAYVYEQMKGLILSNTFHDLSKSKNTDYLLLALVFGIDTKWKYNKTLLENREYNDKFEQFDHLLTFSQKEHFTAIEHGMKQSILDYLCRFIESPEDKCSIQVKRVANLYNIDLEKIVNEAKEQIQIPKSWGFGDKEMKKYNL